jgi:glucose-6-phosphate 1-dehydrogenase
MGRHLPDTIGGRVTRSTTIGIFGVTGDLSRRKLIPGLFSLFMKKRLPEPFVILGSGSRSWSHSELRGALREGVERQAEYDVDPQVWTAFARRVFYQPADLTSDGSFVKYGAALMDLEEPPANRLFYLATPPEFFGTIVSGLAGDGLLNQRQGWRRVVIEKPFGHDLESARELNQFVHRFLAEDQIYRIDHYLGKETVQNLLIFRFANLMFEPIWNANYIHSVQITVAEKVGVENRARYYDQAGVLRDMFQNHLLQLLALVAMEPPASFRADAIRDERAKALSAVRPTARLELSQDTVRAQYEGYRQEEGVASDSQAATYAALRLWVDNWRWKGVPFLLRSGKKLMGKATEIVIQFKEPPHLMFPLPEDYPFRSDLVALCLQPDEGIHLRFEAKVPDTVAEMRPVEMDFHYNEAFGKRAIPDAYERLLLDALSGDMSLFLRNDQIELSWGIIDPILKGWREVEEPSLSTYAVGSWGPSEADDLIGRAGTNWRIICDHCC